MFVSRPCLLHACCLCSHLCVCVHYRASMCMCVRGVLFLYGLVCESEVALREPFGNNSGLLLGIPCFPFLGTSCSRCNMITVTTAAIAVATDLQVNKGEEEKWRGGGVKRQTGEKEEGVNKTGRILEIEREHYEQFILRKNKAVGRRTSNNDYDVHQICSWLLCKHCHKRKNNTTDCIDKITWGWEHSHFSWNEKTLKFSEFLLMHSMNWIFFTLKLTKTEWDKKKHTHKR